MSEPTAVPAITHRDLYSLHPEDWVTQQKSHFYELSYLLHGLEDLLPDWFVGADMAIYWVPGQFSRPYVGADIIVSRHVPSDPDPKVYLVHVDGPISFVAEVASDSTRAGEANKRDEDYGRILHVPEYLFIDLHRTELALYRLVGETYERVPADSEGRVWSRELGVGFMWDLDGRKLIHAITPDEQIVPTPKENAEGRRVAEEQAQRYARRATFEANRADAEARRAESETEARVAAERQVREEAERRSAAERQAREEAERRSAAEQRAGEEARRRAEVEQRNAALQAELERLRRARDGE